MDINENIDQATKDKIFKADEYLKDDIARVILEHQPQIMVGKSVFISAQKSADMATELVHLHVCAPTHRKRRAGWMVMGSLITIVAALLGVLISQVILY
jgi:hypothetical protein